MRSRLRELQPFRSTALLAVAVAPALLAGAATRAGAAVHRITFGHSVDGRKLTAVRLGNPDASRTGLVVGSIHGNETQGHEIIHDLRHRSRNVHGVNLWIVKSVNPDGVAADTRKNAHGVDLNRNFSYRWRDDVPRSSGYYPDAIRSRSRRAEPCGAWLRASGPM